MHNHCNPMKAATRHAPLSCALCHYGLVAVQDYCETSMKALRRQESRACPQDSCRGGSQRSIPCHDVHGAATKSVVAHLPQDTIEAFDYRAPPKKAGTPSGPRWGGGYRRPGTWIEYAKQFADTVNGCALPPSPLLSSTHLGTDFATRLSAHPGVQSAKQLFCQQFMCQRVAGPALPISALLRFAAILHGCS